MAEPGLPARRQLQCLVRGPARNANPPPQRKGTTVMVTPDGGSGGQLPPGDNSWRAAMQRLGWPENALAICDHMAARFPGNYAWWTPSPYPDPGFHPARGAALAKEQEPRNIYARTPEELTRLIAEDITARRDGAGQRDG